MRLERRVPKFFTHQQVAEILNVPVCEVRDLEAAGELVPRRFFTRWRFSEDELLRYIYKIEPLGED